MEKSREIGWKNFGKKIKFFAPSFIHYENSYFHSSPTVFPSISITGNSCYLKCKHCGGRVLETMIPATTPDALFDVCQTLKNQHCRGCLISGGCSPDGSVPFNSFLETITRIKRELGLKIIIHTGILNGKTAKELKDAGIDAALIDIIGADDTIKEIYNLNIHIEDYEASLRALRNSKIPFVPHVIVGLHKGKLNGESNALEMISKYSPNALVILALIPIRGTALESCRPPLPEDVARVLAKARIILPTTPIALGCMRPTGSHRVKTDIFAVKAGVDAIAFPEKKAIDLAKLMGVQVTFSPLCCSQIYEELIK